MGKFRLQQDQDAVSKFHTPLMNTINTQIAAAMKARANVGSARLFYDSLRQRLKSASPDRAEPIRADMERAEDAFVNAVDEAMGKMKAVVTNGQILRCLSDLVAIQLQYHKVMLPNIVSLSCAKRSRTRAR
jgi:hypothetical protein